jgi:osmotically-inducible protein OsmY
MLERTARWLVAAAIASAMTAVGCARPTEPPRVKRERVPITEDRSVVHAFDTQMEARLLDRLELDNFLRERDIRLHVMDGLVSVTGEVWTPLERQRVSELIRGVPGVIDVYNELAVRPPE